MKISTAFAILVTSIALTACSSNIGTETEAMKPAKEEAKPIATEAIATEQQQCAAAGGSWGFVTRGAKGCKYTYSDGGKACSDGKQCQAGACLAKSVDKSATLGSCPANTSNKNSSCFGFIRNGSWFPKPCF